MGRVDSTLAACVLSPLRTVCGDASEVKVTCGHYRRVFGRGLCDIGLPLPQLRTTRRSHSTARLDESHVGVRGDLSHSQRISRSTSTLSHCFGSCL